MKMQGSLKEEFNAIQTETIHSKHLFADKLINISLTCVLDLLFTISYSMAFLFPDYGFLSNIANEADRTLNGTQKMIVINLSGRIWIEKHSLIFC